MKNSLIYIDMDDTLCDFLGAFNQAVIENPAIQFPQSQYGFFSGLKPLEGAVDAMMLMLNSDKIDPYILTAPSVRNPLCYTEKRVWVENNLNMEFVERLIISPNKGLNKGDFLIDDITSGRGQESFEGELIHFGSANYPNWESVIDYLKLLNKI